MHATIAVAVTGDVAGLGVVGELVAVGFTATLLMNHGVAGQHCNAVDVVVVQLIRITGHQVVVVIQLLDVRQLAFVSSDHDATDLLVGIEIHLGQIAGHLHGALGEQDVALDRADGVGRVEAVETVGMLHHHRLVAIILLRERWLQSQQAERGQAELEHSACAERECRGRHGAAPYGYR